MRDCTTARIARQNERTAGLDWWVHPHSCAPARFRLKDKHKQGIVLHTPVTINFHHRIFTRFLGLGRSEWEWYSSTLTKAQPGRPLPVPWQLPNRSGCQFPRGEDQRASAACHTRKAERMRALSVSGTALWVERKGTTAWRKSSWEKAATWCPEQAKAAFDRGPSGLRVSLQSVIVRTTIRKRESDHLHSHTTYSTSDQVFVFIWEVRWKVRQRWTNLFPVWKEKELVAKRVEHTMMWEVHVFLASYKEALQEGIACLIIRSKQDMCEQITCGFIPKNSGICLGTSSNLI